MRRKLLVLTAVLALALLGATSASAAPPANDNFTQAATIDGLPYEDGGDLVDTTTEDGEPQFCNHQAQTVWYVFTPSTTSFVRADIADSDFGVVLNIYRSFGDGFGSLSFEGCLGSGDFRELRFEAGATYYLQAGSVSPGNAQLQLSLTAVPPPANDAFADATAIDALPFDERVDLRTATLEPAEPTLPASTPIEGSVWYSYRPPEDGRLTVRTFPIVAVYTGTSLSDLQELGTASGFNAILTFPATGGTTYFFQLGRLGPSFPSPTTFRLEVTPPPNAAFGFFPFDPSSFDRISFTDASSDPAGVGIESQRWDFGDGSTGDGCCPFHRYPIDGEYSVELEVTTPDGRTASSSRVVSIETHDVAITRIDAPRRARAGQTRQITVVVKNTRYDETVQVRLERSVPGVGFDLVGVAELPVPARTRGRGTTFTFIYGFRPEDAELGKVTFRATAAIVGARDALAGDNDAIAPPTRVRP
jgi:PKD repeat protein